MKFPRFPRQSDIVRATLATRESSVGVSSFLTDKRAAESIVNFIDPAPSDNVCELGAGFGHLSVELLKRNVKKLLAVEFNRDCISHLTRIKQLNPQFSIKHGNPHFMDFHAEYASKTPEERLIVSLGFANFYQNFFYLHQLIRDYTNSTQLFSYQPVLISGWFVEQRANRMCGNTSIPGKPFDIVVSNYFHTELGPVIPSHCFTSNTYWNGQVVKLRPRVLPVLDISLERLEGIIGCITYNVTGEKRYGKKELWQVLARKGILTPDNEKDFVREFEGVGLSLERTADTFGLGDLKLLVEISHLFPSKAELFGEENAR